MRSQRPGRKAAAAANRWRWERLYGYDKPTIAMVHGYCVGGAFMQLLACDFAIAAENAIFSLSEVNWGILPGALVSKAVADTVLPRHALYYACLGEPFDGKYTVSASRHVFVPDTGYTTSVTVSGAQDRTLRGLVDPVGADACGQFRYRPHDLVALYARELACGVCGEIARSVAPSRARSSARWCQARNWRLQ